MLDKVLLIIYNRRRSYVLIKEEWCLKETDIAYLAGIIDGEGTITLTRMHNNENRRPVISISSTDLELLYHINELIGGWICKKKNYQPNKHKLSYTLIIKKKETVFFILTSTLPYLRVPSKIKRAKYILDNYERVTPRNGKYSDDLLLKKQLFEQKFFQL